MERPISDGESILGNPNRVEEVSMPFWASHTMIQFDFLSCLAPGSELAFYSHFNCHPDDQIATFDFAFPNSNKYLVLSCSHFWFKFTSKGKEYGNRVSALPRVNIYSCIYRPTEGGPNIAHERSLPVHSSFEIGRNQLFEDAIDRQAICMQKCACAMLGPPL